MKIFTVSLLVTVLSVCVPAFGKSSYPLNDLVSITTNLVDEEYDRYKKKGDDFYSEGRYVEAQKQYRNCLEVPGFEKDSYATERIRQCEQLIALQQQADAAQAEGKTAIALNFREQILNKNPGDPLTKKKLADYWTASGTQYFEQKRYAEAKTSYERALTYDPGNQLLSIQIKNVTAILSQPTAPAEPKNTATTTPVSPTQTTSPTGTGSGTVIEPVSVRYKHNVVPKVLAVLVGAGAGYYAYQLRNDYNTKLAALNQISQRVDPDGDNVIIGESNYTEWQTAYQNTQTAYNKKGLASACIGVAALAAATEVYLLVKKRKTRQSPVQVGAASGVYGMAVRLTL